MLRLLKEHAGGQRLALAVPSAQEEKRHDEKDTRSSKTALGRIRGKIIRMDPSMRFGFLQRTDGGPDVRFLISDLPKKMLSSSEKIEGTQIIFKVNDTSGEPRAERICRAFRDRVSWRISPQALLKIKERFEGWEPCGCHRRKCMKCGRCVFRHCLCDDKNGRIANRLRFLQHVEPEAREKHEQINLGKLGGEAAEETDATRPDTITKVDASSFRHVGRISQEAEPRHQEIEQKCKEVEQKCRKTVERVHATKKMCVELEQRCFGFEQQLQEAESVARSERKKRLRIEHSHQKKCESLEKLQQDLRTAQEKNRQLKLALPKRVRESDVVRGVAELEAMAIRRCPQSAQNSCKRRVLSKYHPDKNQHAPELNHKIYTSFQNMM
jgi:cold shock CspA family protein